ncbi:MAG TPA: phage portal protein [Sphingobium sp.]|nr:phage portal protein [Sphingobium sp.]
MRIAFEFQRGGREQRSLNPLENPSVSTGSSTEDLLAFFGLLGNNPQLPPVTIDTALEVPSNWCAVNFLSRMMASLPLHLFRKVKDGSERVDGDLQMLLNEAPNPEWTSQGWREYMWSQVFTGGRGTSWIERQGSKVVALWPMDPDRTSVRRRNGRKFYRFDNKEYPAADVIDVTFLLKRNQLDVYSPIYKNKRAIGLMLAMNDYASSFFASGGTPPLALEGPLPQGPEAFKRAQADIQRAIDLAKQSGSPFFGMPPGHKLNPIGIDPQKGQTIEARQFQIGESSRIWQLPPVFLHDLTKGTFNNTEQQDLQLVKHVVTHWAGKFEQELNLKLFGQRSRARHVEHNVDGVQRGDFKSRVEGIARAIQTAQMTPNEARKLENREPMPEGDQLYIQGATVPLGTQPVLKAPQDNGEPNAEPGDKTES